MGFSGRLEGIAPSDIFQIISQNRMTGTLIARCQDRTAMVVFKNGQVIEAASDASQESLGSLLVSQGLVTEKTIEAAERRMKKHPDKPLGSILLDMEAISAKALEEIVLKQITHIFHLLVSCEDGFITFDRGETAVKRKINTREFMFPSGVSPEFLMMEDARVVDEERRHGTDRRAHTKGPLQEPSLDAGEQRESSAALRHRHWWRREINLPRMKDLLDFAGSVLQVGIEFTEAGLKKGNEFVKTVGNWFRGSALPRFLSVTRTLYAFARRGNALIYGGIVGIAAGTGLLLMIALSFQPPATELVITGRVVNIRSLPAVEATPIAKADKGETVSLISSELDWHQVRTQEGATGWIWSKLAEPKENKNPNDIYGMIGAWLVYIASLALFITGIMRSHGVGIFRTAPPLRGKP